MPGLVAHHIREAGQKRSGLGIRSQLVIEAVVGVYDQVGPRGRVNERVACKRSGVGFDRVRCSLREDAVVIRMIADHPVHPRASLRSEPFIRDLRNDPVAGVVPGRSRKRQKSARRLKR